MPKLTKKQRIEWDYFINPESGRRAYNQLCRKCCKECKQSYKAVIVNCPNYQSKQSKAAKALRKGEANAI